MNLAGFIKFFGHSVFVLAFVLLSATVNKLFSQTLLDQTSQPTTKLELSPGINWISIPRHMGNGDHDDYGPWPLVSVFAKTNFEDQYVALYLEQNKVSASSENLVRATCNITTPGGWYYEHDMDNIYSYCGYKLNVYQETPNILTLNGNVESPNTTINLYKDKENWVGYFLPGEQDIFDALAGFMDQLYMIKHQDYFCFRGIYGVSVPAKFHQWICDAANHNIAYGEMVVLKPYNSIVSPAFKWNSSGSLPRVSINKELAYYSYRETADYSAFIIELDSTPNPIEMGAFVNGRCIGACTLAPGDTLAIIKGYFGGKPGSSIVFEEYFGGKSTNINRISNYYVYNPQKKIKEKRVIRTGENRNMYFISLKPNDDQKPIDVEHSFTVFCNPSSHNFNIEYRLHGEYMVNIEAYDIYGRTVAVIVNSSQLSGLQNLTWNLKGNNGQQVCPGIYTIRIKAGSETVTKKVVIN